MEGRIGLDTVLDYALFQISSTQNSYEALVYSEGETEKLVSGPLDKLALYLPQAKGFQSNSFRNSFKLQLGKSYTGSSWFTKFTLSRFLHIINFPEAIKYANEIANEISKLEDTRRFHLTLYSKGQLDHSGEISAGGHSKDVGLTHIEVEAQSSDATKNELLRAVESRILVLKEELIASLKRAAGDTLSVKQLTDISAFAQHFKVRDLRDPLVKYLSLISHDQVAESLVVKMILDDTRKEFQGATKELCPPSPKFVKIEPSNNGISPVKIAQVNPRSSTESEESSESSDEDQILTERSRTFIRSATPRRSASPMRRVQIGRSGSRRSAALTIKSLNYFPVRERIPPNRNSDENNSEDELTSQPAKRSESTARRMSVQEAINLFESKQKVPNLDVQKRRASGEVSLTNKAVLRRWSSGMSVSLTSSQDNSSEAISQDASINLVSDTGDNKLIHMKAGFDINPVNLNAATSETAQTITSPEAEKMVIRVEDSRMELLKSHAVEIDDTETTSVEWSKNKGEELNQILTKMVERRPAKNLGTIGAYGGSMPAPNEQRGGFYSQYKEKRDEKLRAESVKKHLVMEAQFKVLQETLKQSKAEMVSKSKVISQKLDRPSDIQQSRRSSSPPVLHKEEIPKTTASRKALSKATLPITRASWSSGTLRKASGTCPAKASPRLTPANTTPSRKSQMVPSASPPSTKTERSLHQSKAKIDCKPSMKCQGEKKQKTTKTNKTLKAKAPLAAGDDSYPAEAKPSFYNKVTKKSSVVPLEVKPFLKKGTGIGSGVGRVITKTKVSHSDDSSKNDDKIQGEKNDLTLETTEPTTKEVEVEVDVAQQANDVDENLDTSLDNDLNIEKTEHLDQSLAEINNGLENTRELPVAEIQREEEIGISSAAWVEVEHQEVSTANDAGLLEVSVANAVVSLPIPSSDVRHSLSQMLQADNNEPGIIEWGNAENPPAIIHHKDAPKGLKRLLMFARKSKGEAHVTGWASPSIYSEGVDVPEDSKDPHKKNLDTRRKAVLQAKGFGQQNSIPSENLHAGNSSKNAVEYRGVHDVTPGHDGHISSTAASTKSRSFFSLSTFRSSKSSETKPQ
ncbi:muscle M-line assembly protein unc-89-like isoform X2 [Canna indica]|uniref:Muscle M-line assembly protein unc-89-like isoform X2 n=1 Tax=Canna indica TaxID=4628 RepID=A0AAQ3KI32_9LILI|nr:muscle M-line assembly protein unc-89-like isoform X2 [Canna indica]